jgi:[ribosomal protein S5]-alanine N-acetyltransferase
VNPIRPIAHGLVALRPVGRRDYWRLQYLLTADRDWLEPWEATTPGLRTVVNAGWMISSLKSQARRGTGLGFVILHDNVVVGQLNVANIQYGSVSSATIGYWIARSAAGKNITPTALALAIDYLMDDVGLHRVEIDIRPENLPSLRVVEKLSLRLEGIKERFIHIDGAWRDHKVFAITSEEKKGSMLDRLANTRSQ